MNPTLIAVVAALIAGLVGSLASAAASARTRRRAAKRRRRHVDRHPRTVNLGDVERRVADHLPRPQADAVMARVAREGIDSRTLWQWLNRYGAHALLHALVSGHGYADVVRILEADRPPDPDELALLARLAAPELFEARTPPGARADL